MTDHTLDAREDVRFCLDGAGVSDPGWQTLIIAAAADSSCDAQDLWAVWSDLERWPSWSPLHKATAWTGPAGFAAGATFQQTLDLGFPAGTPTEHVTLDIADPARRVSWSGNANGVRSCHLWTFTPLPGGGTRVGNTEVFTGTVIGLTKPLLAPRWRRQFQQAVDGLLRQATPVSR